jgi:hypothetical protein
MIRSGWRRAVVICSLLIASAAWSAEPAPAADKPSRPASVDAMPAVAAPAPKANAKTTVGEKSSASTEQPAKRPNSDRLNLDATVVTGNRELPKVLYIVPWKRSELGDLPQQPLNSLLDEVLTPVDRDVFRREVTYFGAMTEKESAAGAPPAGSAAGSEK